MANLVLDVYGVGVVVTASGAAAEETVLALAEDFSHFVKPTSAAEAAIRLELNEGLVPSTLSPRGRPLFRTRMCAVHGWGRKRLCDYGDGALVEADNHPKVRSFRAFARDRDSLYEIAYMTLLSAVGEALDQRGFHRVHALGIEANGRAGVVILPQGGGKSAIAALLMKDRRIRIFSDESPLLHGDGIYPFPVRLALKAEVAAELGLGEGRRFARRIFPEKRLFAIPAGKVAPPMPLSFVMSGVQVDDVAARPAPAIEASTFSGMLSSLCKSMVVGIGVAQMAEHMLRAPSALELAGIAFRRFTLGVRVTQICPRYVFYVVRDARKNAQVLSDFLLKT